MSTSSGEHPAGWSGRDVLAVLVIGAGLGVVYALVFVPFSVWLYGALGQDRPLESLINGIWLWGGFLAVAWVGKPGGLLVGETVAAFVEVCIQACPLCAGSGILIPLWEGTMSRDVLNPIVISGLLQGAGGELVFALRRYARWDLGTWMLAGVGAAFFSWISGIYVTRSYLEYDALPRFLILLSSSLSMALLAGAPGWWVYNRRARSRS